MAGAVIAGFAVAVLLAVFGVSEFAVFVPAAVGLAVLIVAVRGPAYRSPVVTAILAAGVMAVVLYVVLFGLAIFAIPEDFQEAI